MKLKVLLQADADGGYSASIPALPGCHSQGDTFDETLANVREAAELWFEVQVERATREASVVAPAAQLEEIEL